MKPGRKGPTAKRQRVAAQVKVATELATGASVDEAAKAAGVHPATVYRWAKASDDDFATMLREQKRRLAGWWDTIADGAAAELARRTVEASGGETTRDLAGLLHLASQHQERCIVPAKDEPRDLEQPMTLAEFDALARRMGYVRAEAE